MNLQPKRKMPKTENRARNNLSKRKEVAKDWCQKTSLLLLILVQGCGTLIAHSDLSAGAGASRFYRGVQYDGKNLDGPFGVAVMCDVPFSLVADTLMIPFDAGGHHVVEQPPYPIGR